VKFEIPSSGLPRAFRALANEAMVTEDGPRPLAELGAVAARRERRRSRRPCHLRAISSGHQRYVAVSHGSLETTVAPGSGSLTWGGGEGRNCMACKGSRCCRGLANPFFEIALKTIDPLLNGKVCVQTARWYAFFNGP
jgi:hypothetical protein